MTDDSFRAVALKVVAAGKRRDPKVGPVDALAEAKLLMTPSARAGIAREALVGLYQQLEQVDAAGLMRARWGRNHGSPRELLIALLEWMEVRIDG